MEAIDWIVILITLIFIITYGIWKNNSQKNIQDYIKGGNKARWWTIGLSVMATQASAITFLSTPGLSLIHISEPTRLLSIWVCGVCG